MNKRIKELAEQAGAISLHSDPKNRALVGMENIEKFAELIVQDIILIVEGYCETSPEIWGLPLDILEHFNMELPDD